MAPFLFVAICLYLNPVQFKQQMSWQIDPGSTVSIGVADTQLQKDFDALVDLADQALYQAKREGRNCVRTAQQPLHHEKDLTEEAVSTS